MDERKQKLVENLNTAINEYDRTTGTTEVNNLKIKIEDVAAQLHYLTANQDLRPEVEFDDNKFETMKSSLAEFQSSETPELTSEKMAMFEMIYDPGLPYRARDIVRTSFNQAYTETLQDPAYTFKPGSDPKQINQTFNQARDKIFDSVKNKILKSPLAQEFKQKVMTRLGTLAASALGVSTGGLATAIQIGMTALGSIRRRLGNTIGRLIPGVWKGINNWMTRNSKEIAAVSVMAAIASPVAIPLIIVSVGAGAAAFVAGGGAAFAASGSIIVGLLAAFIIGTITMAVTPIIVTLFAIPLSLAFVLLVFTTSSYVVPKGEPIVFKEDSSGNDPNDPNNPGYLEPTDTCFTFKGDWPSGYKPNMELAINVMARAGVYTDKLCAAGEIFLTYSGPNTYGGKVISNNEIQIYSYGTYTYNAAMYTLAHESAHIYSRRNGGYADYVVSAFSEGVLCSYPLDFNEYPDLSPEDEGHAEMIAMYIHTSPLLGGRDPGVFCFAPNMKTTYPLTFSFARDNRFGGNTFGH